MKEDPSNKKQRYITDLSGDSTAEIHFEDQEVTCLYDDWELAKRFKFRLKSKIFYSETIRDGNGVHIITTYLPEYISCDPTSFRYIMPNEPVAQLKMVSRKLHLAVGLDSREWKYLIEIKGNATILAIPVKEIRDIIIWEENNFGLFELTIDLSTVKTLEEFHILFARTLIFPPYYGKTWDAFWDTITGIIEMPDRLLLTGWDHFHSNNYQGAKKLVKMIKEYNLSGAGKQIIIV